MRGILSVPLLAILLLATACTSAPKEAPGTAAPVAASEQLAAMAPDLWNKIFPHQFVLVIGNSEYRSLAPVEGAKEDAQTLALFLRREYGFTINVIANADASRIESVLELYARQLRIEDYFLLYYAGHSFIDPNTNECYWLPVDAGATDRTKWISSRRISELLRRMDVYHVLVLTDGCYSGTRRRAAATPLDRRDAVWTMLDRPSHTVMTSRKIESAVGATATKASRFAAAIEAALARTHGAIEGYGLFESVRDDIGPGGVWPAEYGDIEPSTRRPGDFVFVRRQ